MSFTSAAVKYGVIDGRGEAARWLSNLPVKERDWAGQGSREEKWKFVEWGGVERKQGICKVSLQWKLVKEGAVGVERQGGSCKISLQYTEGNGEEAVKREWGGGK